MNNSLKPSAVAIGNQLEVIPYPIYTAVRIRAIQVPLLIEHNIGLWAVSIDTPVERMDNVVRPPSVERWRQLKHGSESHLLVLRLRTRRGHSIKIAFVQRQPEPDESPVFREK